MPAKCGALTSNASLSYTKAQLPNYRRGNHNGLSEHPTDNVTQLLIELSNGDRDAVDLLLPVIYDELRKLAANYLRRERPDHTLQPTALVHEAYLRLVDQTRVNWQNRAHFFGVAAQIMRRLLVDHARKHNAEKRGQDFQKLSLDENIDRAVERSAELIALDDALEGPGRIRRTKSAHGGTAILRRPFNRRDSGRAGSYADYHQTSLAVGQGLALR